MKIILCLIAISLIMLTGCSFTDNIGRLKTDYEFFNYQAGLECMKHGQQEDRAYYNFSSEKFMIRCYQASPLRFFEYEGIKANAS